MIPGSPESRTARLLAIERLLLVAVVILSVAVYPLRLQSSWITPLGMNLQSGGAAERWLWRAIEPYLAFAVSPLMLRGALAGFPMLLFIASVTFRLTFIPFRIAAPHRLLLSGGAFLAWALISGFWSPTPDLALAAAMWAALYGSFFLALLARGISAHEARLLAALLIALGTLVLIVLFLQALPVFQGWIYKIMYVFDDREKRNLRGSIIGHNTGAAAFVALCAFPATAWFFAARQTFARLCAAAWLFSAVFGMLLLQSRAVWIIAPVLGVLAFHSLWRASGRGLPRGLWPAAAAVFVLLLATQIVPSRWNLLRDPELSLASRLNDFTPDRLYREARLRLNVIGATLVPEHPVAGHGLFAFQYVFGKRQGEYFNAHPDSKLNQTENRSNMAHNEYLQTLIDHGAIGLGLLLWFAFEAGAAGRPARAGLLHQAFGWASLYIALHAVVDFPFHLPHLLVPWTACVASWSAFRTTALPEIVPAPDGAAFRPAVAVKLLAFMLSLAAVPLGSLKLATALQGDALYCTGLQLKGSFDVASRTNPPAPIHVRRSYLTGALNSYQRALYLTPANYMIHGDAAQVFLNMGLLDAEESRTAPPERSKELQALAIENLRRAIHWTREATKGIDYYFQYFIEARAWRELARLEPGRGYDDNYRQLLAKTLAYTPSSTQAIYELAEASVGRIEPEQVTRMRRRVLAQSPDLFSQYYIFPANFLRQEGRYEESLPYWTAIHETEPKNALWRSEWIEALLLSGERAQGLAALDAFETEDPKGFVAFGAVIAKATLTGRWNTAIRYLSTVENYDPVQRSRFRALEVLLREKQGLSPEIPFHKRLASVAADDWDRLVADHSPELLRVYFNDLDRARAACQSRIAMPGPSPTGRFWLEALRISVALRDRPFAQEAVQRAREAMVPDAAIGRIARGLAGL